MHTSTQLEVKEPHKSEKKIEYGIKIVHLVSMDVGTLSQRKKEDKRVKGLMYYS
jgi:hypothetical protein